MYMVSGDTPERQVMDNIVKVRWQTHAIRVYLCFWGGGIHYFLDWKHRLYGGLDRIGINVEAFAVYSLYKNDYILFRPSTVLNHQI